MTILQDFLNSDILLKIGLAIGLSFIILIFLFITFKIFFNYIREGVLKQKSLNLAFFEIKIPQSNEVEIKAAEQMYSGLSTINEELKGLAKYIGANTFISFEIIAFKESIRFFLVCPKKIAAIVDRQINGTYPLAEIDSIKEYNIFKENGSVSYAVLELAKESKIPIQTFEELPVDTIATLTDTFSKLEEGESAAFQMVFTPVSTEWRNKVKQFVKKSREKPAEDGDKDKPKPKPPKNKIDEEALNMIDKKISKPNFYTDVRVLVVAEDKALGDSHLANILSTFNQFAKEGGNRLKKSKDKKLTKNIVTDFIYRISRKAMVLNTGELATLFHLPNKNIKTPHIKWLLSKSAPSPDFVTSKFDDDYMYIGKNTHRGSSKEIFMKPDDRLRHFYVIGQTGTGKSKFMAGMMIRDMRLGHGCAWIEPHGTDAELILQQVPPERVDDVIFFDPSDIERPIGLNMLEFTNDAQRTMVTNEMLNIFDTLFDLRTTGGPIFEQYFRFGIMLLTEDPESGCTLMEVPKIFADDGYREYKLSKSKNQEVIDFWRKQAEKAGGEASLKNIVPYIVSKLAPFLTNAYIRPIISQQTSAINFRKIMDEGKILIVKLSKGKIGDYNANLLGMIIIGKLLVGALEREDLEEKKRRPFYLYIDEFQNFLTDGINIILSEARKYKLGLTMGHQFLGQLTRANNNTKIRDAVFGNVGNKAIMRVGEDDAAFLKKVVEGPFDESDLQQLPNITAVTKLLVDGKPTPPFTIRSFYGESPYDLISEYNKELAETVKQISRLKYGRDITLVENEIKQRGSFIKEKKTENKGGGLGDFGFGF